MPSVPPVAQQDVTLLDVVQVSVLGFAGAAILAGLAERVAVGAPHVPGALALRTDDQAELPLLFVALTV